MKFNGKVTREEHREVIGPVSILDNDLYKLSMGNGVMQKYSNVSVTYRFTDRAGKGKWTKEAVRLLKRKIKAMRKLALTDEERQYCEKTFPWINRSFWDYLKLYRYDPREVVVWLDKDKNLQLQIKGLWCRTIFWEVPLLALISEVYFAVIDTNWTDEGQDELMFSKAQRLFENNVSWADFGTRRRRHFGSQERVVAIASQFKNFTGTSNVYLAMKYGVKALGTMAHEWIMAHAAIFSSRHANKFALEAWNDVYKGNLGTALPDTFGTKSFLKDFNGTLTRCFDSVRHDSGPWKEWAEMMIAHYSQPTMNVDWKTKPLGFTDGNTVDSAIEINAWVKEKSGKCWFGIGTSMSNDYGPQSPATNIVIKLTEVQDDNGTCIPVVKLSDTPSKASGDPNAIRVAMWEHLAIPLDDASHSARNVHYLPPPKRVKTCAGCDYHKMAA